MGGGHLLVSGSRRIVPLLLPGYSMHDASHGTRPPTPVCAVSPAILDRSLRLLAEGTTREIGAAH